MTSADSLVEQLTTLEQRALEELRMLADVEGLEDWRIRYMGRRQGLLPKLLEQLPSIPVEDRRTAGARGNQARKALEFVPV